MDNSIAKSDLLLGAYSPYYVSKTQEDRFNAPLAKFHPFKVYKQIWYGVNVVVVYCNDGYNPSHCECRDTRIFIFRASNKYVENIVSASRNASSQIEIPEAFYEFIAKDSNCAQKTFYVETSLEREIKLQDKCVMKTPSNFA